jgi:hypothetical protein
LQAAEMDKQKYDKDKEVDIPKVLATKTSSRRFPEVDVAGITIVDSC